MQDAVAPDWRLEHLRTQPYLLGVSFERKPYRAYREGWDHDHCCGCWTTLAEPGSAEEGAIHEGFATTADYPKGADYEWACPDCFLTFAQDMQWTDVTPAKGG